MVEAVVVGGTAGAVVARVLHCMMTSSEARVSD